MVIELLPGCLCSASEGWIVWSSPDRIARSLGSIGGTAIGLVVGAPVNEPRWTLTQDRALVAWSDGRVGWTERAALRALSPAGDRR